MNKIDELRIKLLHLWEAPKFNPEDFASIHLGIRKCLFDGERGDPDLMKFIERQEGWVIRFDRKRGRPVRMRTKKPRLLG